ncbi:MAG: hypothetical protein ACRDWH_04290, partial [Acidimicrobiia bacterium]
SLLSHDLDDWLERTLLEGPSVRKELQRLKDEAEKVKHSIPEVFRGIGVRIEDDILIIEDGHRNLSRLVPAAIDDVESLCTEASWLARSS